MDVPVWLRRLFEAALNGDRRMIEAIHRDCPEAEESAEIVADFVSDRLPIYREDAPAGG